MYFLSFQDASGFSDLFPPVASHRPSLPGASSPVTEENGMRTPVSLLLALSRDETGNVWVNTSRLCVDAYL